VVERLLDEYQSVHCKEFYYSERARSHKTRFHRAAQFIYLNRTCFNGMYRVNKKGEFNVPIGTKTSVLLGDDFRSISRSLRDADLSVADFEETVGLASEGDMLFADPPYTVKHNVNGFVKYNENIFSWGDQIRLRDALVAAQKRGAYIVCTNADHDLIREIYEPYFCVSEIKRPSVLAAKRNARSIVSEVIITNRSEE
jgi:DNA adenine methylase